MCTPGSAVPDGATYRKNLRATRVATRLQSAAWQGHSSWSAGFRLAAFRICSTEYRVAAHKCALPTLQGIRQRELCLEEARHTHGIGSSLMSPSALPCSAVDASTLANRTATPHVHPHGVLGFARFVVSKHCCDGNNDLTCTVPRKSMRHLHPGPAARILSAHS